MKAALALLVSGCIDAPLTIDEQPCPPAGTPLTYANFGQPFFAQNCDRCHASASHGAPEAYRFDTLDGVRAHRDRIFVRAAGPNVTMPPGPDDPPRAERDQLAEWLACGAP
jgi:mono/diheme cytochrome c family protein